MHVFDGKTEFHFFIFLFSGIAIVVFSPRKQTAECATKLTDEESELRAEFTGAITPVIVSGQTFPHQASFLSRYFFTQNFFHPNFFFIQNFFHPNFFFIQNFFSPKFFFHPKFFSTQNFFSPPKKISPLSLFYVFLDVLCHPECSKKFSPKIFLGEARRDTMLPSISSFISLSSGIALLLQSFPHV